MHKRSQVLFRIIDLMVMFVMIFGAPMSAFAAPSPTGATITSQLADYPAGATVLMTGAGWAADESVNVVVTADDQSWTLNSSPADPIADSAGAFTYEFQLPDWYVPSYTVAATGFTSGTATVTFTDAPPSPTNLEQCDPPTGYNAASYTCASSGPNGWVTGNDDGPYNEGDTVPYRIGLDNLIIGHTYNVTIEWDTTKGSKHALDYLKSYNATITAADPCDGMSAFCPGSAVSLAIPADTFMQSDAAWIANSGVQDSGNFTFYGVSSPSASAYTTPANYSGDTSTSITLSFTAQSSKVLMAWGGHIAERDDWGLDNSAVSISGSPYHMRFLTWTDGNTGETLGGGNQDRSLSAEAVIYPGSITIIKDATPNGSTSFGFTALPKPPLSDFSLVDDGTSANTKLFSNILVFQTYTVNESSIPAGWGFDSVSCSVTSGNGGGYTTSTTTVNINMKEGENWTCTYLDSQRTGTLTVIKHVINDNGGTKAASDFTLHVKSSGNDVTGSPAAGSESGTTYTLVAGTYVVSEDAPPTGYTNVTTDANNGDCDSSGNVTVVVGQNKTCTITNDDNAPALYLVKHVINDNGGTALASAWTLSAGAHSVTGSEAGALATNQAGTYALSETTVAGYTNTSLTCDDNPGVQVTSVTLGLGETKTCTFINDDIAPILHLRKVVINDNGGTATVANFTLTANGTGTNDLSGTSPVDSGAGLKADTWALSETNAYGYSASTWSCVGGTQNGSNITVGIGGEATCTITNNDQPGTIIVKKITKPVNTGSFGFTTTGDNGANTLPDYQPFTLPGGGQNSQTLDAGTYTVKEGTQLGWILTGIGGSTDPNTPYACTVTGSGGSTGVGDLNTQTATINLKNGDTVTCVFENTGNGATRTQGFWATHPELALIAWNGGSDFGHTFPGVAVAVGDAKLCTYDVDFEELMGGFWSDISKKSDGKKRTSLDQAKMQLLQQLLAAELNASAFGSMPSNGTFAQWESAFCGTNQTDIKNALKQAASFNSQGDNSTFTPGTSANSKYARSVANIREWDDTLPDDDF